MPNIRAKIGHFEPTYLRKIRFFGIFSLKFHYQDINGYENQPLLTALTDETGSFWDKWYLLSHFNGNKRRFCLLKCPKITRMLGVPVIIPPASDNISHHRHLLFYDYHLAIGEGS
jgi:hypothetical protein